MHDWQTGHVAANGIRFHYRRTGGAKPSLVLAHGATEDSLCWAPVAEALTADYDVVMVDARGHGHSDAPAEGYDPLTQATDLAAVIAALDLDRPAILGHSMGAMTTLVLAGTFPNVPRAILLEDPGPLWADWPASSADTQSVADMRTRNEAYRRMTREELIAAQRARHPGWSEPELSAVADAKRQVNPAAFAVYALSTAAKVDWPAVVRRITCPVLLIRSDPEQGGIVTAEHAAELQTLAPQARVAHVPDAGHSIRRDQFARYVDAVRAFLAEPATFEFEDDRARKGDRFS